jgi:hypothetical protein
MRSLLAFTSLIARPATFLWGALAVIVVTIAVVGVQEPDVPVLIASDHALLVCFGYPFVAGTLAGMALREFQSSSFAWTLPGVRSRTALGFLACALTLSMVVVALTLSGDVTQNLVLLTGFGTASFYLGAVSVHPASRWLGFASSLLALLVVFESGHMARLIDTYLLTSVSLTAVLTGLCMQQLFGLSVFRGMPSIPTSPMAGAFSLNASLRMERLKLVTATHTHVDELPAGFDHSIWSWVRAAAYESYGPQPVKVALRSISRLGLLFCLIVLHTLLEPRSVPLLEMIGKITYDALFRPPYLAAIGDRPPYVAVSLWIAAMGAGIVFATPLALRSKLLYPLARRQRSQIAHRASLALGATFAVLMAASFLIVGHLAGWLADYPLRMDFIPFFVRPLLGTLILLPSAQYAAVLSLTSNFTKQYGAAFLLIMGMTAFVTVVLAWSFLLPSVLTLTEMVLSAALLIASQFVYRRALEKRYTQADLV